MKFAGWDIEIAVSVPNGTDWKQCRPLGITCASLVADDLEVNWYAGKSANVYNPRMSVEEIQNMAKTMKSLIPEYQIVTWNGLAFDFDVMAEESLMKRECADLALNHYDIMFQFLCENGFPVGINAVAKGSNLPEKTEGMHGDLAPMMWADGKCQDVIDYNIQDSRMALNIAKYLEENKWLYWITKAGQRKMRPFRKLLTVAECKDLPLPDNSWMTNPPKREDYLAWLNT